MRPEFRPSAQARPGRRVTKLQRNESDGGGYRQRKRKRGSMKKFLSSLLLALTVLITASPVYADGESISSVTVVGATEQSGTPTPSNPVNIVTNNGAIKLSKNLFKVSTWTHGDYLAQDGTKTGSIVWGYSDYIPVQQNTTYYLSGFTSSLGVPAYHCFYDNNKNFVSSVLAQASSAYQINIPSGVAFIRITGRDGGNASTTYANAQFEKGSTATTYHPYGSIYTEGAGETVRDSANHSANVETLFAVGDYADEQNINTGVITRKVGVMVFNGKENWSPWRSGYTTMVLRSIARAKTVPLSNITESVSSKIEIDGSADLNFYNIVTDFPTVTDWKRYIADQYAAGTPVIVIYPLAEPTTESVAGQTMTTAPVIQNNGTIATTIRTLLQNGQTLVSNSLELGIKIATTAYNTAQFNPVVTDLNTTIATIREIVTKTINQTAAIASLQADKQTRPDEQCPAGKKCLLVETEENGVIVPHWYPIIEAPE